MLNSPSTHLDLPIKADTPWLAPLAGWSDLPFRLLCREHEAAVCCSEMISAKGLLYGSTGTKDLLATTEQDTPLVMQIFGNEPEIISTAMDTLLEKGFEYFDLNMGCSVPKVVRTGCGAAMLKDIENALQVAQVMIQKAKPAHVGFKIRLGFEHNAQVWQHLAQALENIGAGWISMHPRYAKQAFTGKADWSYLEKLKKTVKIPVIASGDLFTAQDGINCLEQTGVDCVMYARGAMRDPAIFANHKNLLAKKHNEVRTMAQIHKFILRHAELAKKYSPTRTGILKMRTIVPHYVYNVPEAKTLRQSLITCRTWEDFEKAITDFFTEERFTAANNERECL